jgi:hypothetical protein
MAFLRPTGPIVLASTMFGRSEHKDWGYGDLFYAAFWDIKLFYILLSAFSSPLNDLLGIHRYVFCHGPQGTSCASYQWRK